MGLRAGDIVRYLKEHRMYLGAKSHEKMEHVIIEKALCSCLPEISDRSISEK